MSAKSNVEIVTFGCRLNTYESEVIRNHAEAKGLENTIIFNTCAVTNEAERQARQAIRKARKNNPQARIIVTGCAAQINPEKYSQMAEVDQVLGNQEKMSADSYISNQPVVVSDIMTLKETAHHLISGFESHVRAFIEIQNGCDHRCTFCRIPYGRGNNRSVPMGEIATQVRLLVENGCKEVVFTGVDITGYGQDLPGKPTLGQMMKRVLATVPELTRLRLSSLDPAEVDEDVFDLIAHEPKLMPHFHISLQAGDDMILKRMKRRHLRGDIIAFCQKVRNLRPEAVFGADIIAGFPTETEEMHANSCQLIETCFIPYLHVFPYSAVSGTPAARMPQVNGIQIKQRAENLRVLAARQKEELFKAWVGKTVPILVERNQMGHSEHYLPVQLRGAEQIPVGEIREFLLENYTDKHLIASLK
ncbi:MAG: tRNA (N(6)-L-threonylcarbamoyladenosine(37)-C(2))-methylthiotransferase MtaB [Alphaproteobacteria bacterium]|nr:tRNA (N(6)-L-threonylcarbamoyladenosine(37)-C(2))-methylthiotransferase MtaB [Alphaproteobacteria bacterium]